MGDLQASASSSNNVRNSTATSQPEAPTEDNRDEGVSSLESMSNNNAENLPSIGSLVIKERLKEYKENRPFTPLADLHQRLRNEHRGSGGMRELGNATESSSDSSTKDICNNPTTSKTIDGNENKKTKRWSPPPNWELAPEFVPMSSLLGEGPVDWTVSAGGLIPGSDHNGQTMSEVNETSSGSTRTYAEAVGVSNNSESANEATNIMDGATGVAQSTSSAGHSGWLHMTKDSDLCQYALIGECRYGAKCLLIHGVKCDLCGKYCLHPEDPAQHEKHRRDCVRQHEKDMKLSFSIAKSADKTCGICMEVIVEKIPVGEQRFGILTACNHCFCLSCIRTWRKAEFENKIIRACPECRITSDFVCPSRYWVDTKEEKTALIKNYKNALSDKPCRYYRNGAGSCPFGNKCFYKHALADGTLVDVGPPQRRTRMPNGHHFDPDVDISLWEFLGEWENQWMEMFEWSDSGDSDSEQSDSDDSDQNCQCGDCERGTTFSFIGPGLGMRIGHSVMMMDFLRRSGLGQFEDIEDIDLEEMDDSEELEW